jgi:pimeloyl-ACP methyl ester carboxylesterase
MKHIGRTVHKNRERFTEWSRLGRICALSAFLTTGYINVLGTDAARLPVVSVAASADDGNAAANTLDGSLATRWSAQGDGQWIRFDLGSSVSVAAAKIAWHRGNARIARFDVQTSDDATSWTTVFSGASSGSTLARETYDVSDSVGRYVRIVCHGNSLSLWNSITEVEAYGAGPDGGPGTPPPPVTPPPSLPKIEKALARLSIGSGKVPYYRNRPMDAYDPRVTRAIIVIHGGGGNAEGYFDRINNIIPSSWRENVMVLAPDFQEKTDASSGEYWWDGDWREGGASGGISSYEVLDTMVGLLRGAQFPNLKWVVICGHSAGGQTTVRYAAFTDADLQPAPNAAFMKFVVANPSSYVYLNEYRPDGRGNWTIPQEDCSSGDGYNEWKYGLDGLYGYTAARGADFARAHLPQCQVQLLAGTEDVVADDGFDTDCAAMFQGSTRYERAHNFTAFMDRFYPTNHLDIADVQEIGHDGAGMFASPQGMSALFFTD